MGGRRCAVLRGGGMFALTAPHGLLPIARGDKITETGGRGTAPTCAGNELGVLVPSVPPHGPWDPGRIMRPLRASSPLGFPSSALLSRHSFISNFLSLVPKITSASQPPCSLHFYPYPCPGAEASWFEHLLPSVATAAV